MTGTYMYIYILVLVNTSLPRQDDNKLAKCILSPQYFGNINTCNFILLYEVKKKTNPFYDKIKN